jgi:NAD(P)H-hydrate repair Nnr-like enzyme with NAD(P)H-hydrate dehydratase domain
VRGSEKGSRGRVLTVRGLKAFPSVGEWYVEGTAKGGVGLYDDGRTVNW